MSDSRAVRATRTGALLSILNLRRAVILCAALLSAACHDDGPRKGTVAGTVLLQDAWANRLDDFSGVRIALDDGAASTFTDQTGAWHINEVPTGTHDITFTKTGFGMVRIARQTVAAPQSMAPDVTMALAPPQQAIIDSIHMAAVVNPARTDTFYFFDGHLSAPPPENAKIVSVVVFVGKTASVSADTVSFELANTYTDLTGKQSKFFSVFSVGELRQAFASGTHAFVTAYVNGAACTCTPDLNNRGVSKPVFSGTGPRGNVIELAIP